MLKKTGYVFVGILFYLFLAVAAPACTNDKVEDVIVDISGCDTLMAFYNQEIGIIMDSKCNQPACHNSGSVFGDYSFYSDLLKQSGESGEFKDRVIDNRTDRVFGMPRNDTLTTSELRVMECWIESGFPE